MATMFSFDLEIERFESVRRRLSAKCGSVFWNERLDPLSQLVRSCLGARTYDAVSWKAFFTLTDAFPDWNALVAATPDQVLSHIQEVTFAEDKARHLVSAFRMIKARTGGLSLEFLSTWPIEAAHIWLEGLPNVGPKVAAAVLNFSTLERRSMVIDTHVLRVTARYGLVARDADIRSAWGSLMEMLPEHWTSRDLANFHVQLKNLGQTHCRPVGPDCGRCPLADDCAAKRSH
ncbi:endonuclease III [Brevundimonas sp.]|jgi:endonuclease-3|uniref:endonuclease III domain-containing protein n=1 Tax=Brevundimonas sp. TaxID=1871086 RepID=UPI002E14BC07|nr:endonuclease III [Brevundimonas sp.]